MMRSSIHFTLWPFSCPPRRGLVFGDLREHLSRQAFAAAGRDDYLRHELP